MRLCAFGAAHSGKPLAYRKRSLERSCASGAAYPMGQRFTTSTAPEAQNSLGPVGPVSLRLTAMCGAKGAELSLTYKKMPTRCRRSSSHCFGFAKIASSMATLCFTSLILIVKWRS